MSKSKNTDNVGHLPLESMVPIRTVASLTGVNPVTLRAWERRYNLLRPTRTAKGHRLYSMADVELIRQVLTLLEGGMSIGQVQTVLQRAADEPPPRRLDTSMDTDTVPNTAEADVHSQPVQFDLWQRYQQRLLQAIHDFDDAALHNLYNEILALYPIDLVTTRLIVPLLHELGWRWQRGNQTGVAEEHFFSMFLRNKLGARLHHYSRHQTGPCLLAACLPGEQHDIGLLLFAMVALDWNYRIILLGAATPLPEIAPVCQRTACAGIVLAGSYQSATEVLNTQLPQLMRTVDIPVFIGGRTLNHHAQVFQALGMVPLANDLQQAMQTINSTLQQRE
ncbi:MAG: MerR family transcriptional regulator [Gammaproteobacteria bacterium]